MATTPGQRFVRRHNAARSSTSNTTAADISYDTAVLSEGGYSWASPEVTVDEAGLYLCIYDIGEVQLSGSTRAVGTLVPSVNTTDQTYYKARHRYLRNSGGNHNVSWGACILDLSASDDVKIRNPGALTGTDAIGNYATNSGQGGGFQMIRLNAGNFTEVRRGSNQSMTITYANATRPWLDSTPTLNQITFTSEVRDDDGLYPGTGGDLTLAANTKYLIVYGGTMDGSSSQRHVHKLVLDIDGNNVQRSTGYERNNSSDSPPMQGMYLHETGGTTETLKLHGVVEQEDNAVSNTVNLEYAYLQVLELPSSAEWIHVDNGTTDSLTTAWAGTTTYYDTPLSSTLRADGDSNLSLDSGNNAVQNDSGGSLPVLAIGWMTTDRDSGTSGTRKHVWSYWDNGGTRLAYGISGGYNRGQQGNDDTFQMAFTGAATMDLANGADLSFVSRDPQSGANSDMGVYASTSRYFLGVQVLNLNTLVAGATINEVTRTDTLSTSDDSVELRLRNRENTDEISIVDDSIELRLNRDNPIDSITVTDNVIATYVPDAVINEVTVHSSIVVYGDALIFENVFSTAQRYRNREQANNIDVVDSITTPIISTILQDAITVTDNHFELRLRDREKFDSASVADSDVSFKEARREELDSAIVVDNNFELRQRDRGESDSIDVDDVNVELRERDSEIIEAIDPNDDSVELRLRDRGLLDPITITDNSIPTYIAGAGNVVDITLSDSITVVDFSIELRLRDRENLSALSTVDFSQQLRLRDRGQADSVTAADDEAITRYRNRENQSSVEVDDVQDGIKESQREISQSIDVIDNDTWFKEARRQSPYEEIDVIDDSIELRLRDREIIDTSNVTDSKISSSTGEGPKSKATRIRNRTDVQSISVFDNSISLRERLRQPTENAIVVDAEIISRLRDRGPFESINVDDVSVEITKRPGEIIEVIDASDDSIELRERNRLSVDSVDVTDSIIVTYTGQGQVFSRTLTDLLDINDYSDQIRYRLREQTDSSTINDNNVELRTRNRQRADSLDISESFESLRERLRRIADDATLTDVAIITTDLVVTNVTLTDQLSVLDFVVPQTIIDAGQFFVYHGVEPLEVDNGVEEQIGINYGVQQRTS